MSTCSKCGLCCKLFLINLNEDEYRSGEYLTVFHDMETPDTFNEVMQCGANIIKQQDDGSCNYLSMGECSIHGRRPKVCRGFFCTGNEPKYEGMRRSIEAARLRQK